MCDVFMQLGRGVLALHTHGKLHCDLKPSNVLLDRSGDRVVVVDFGLVANVSEKPAREGTPAYMAPEQDGSEPLTPAADWYSVGVMLFECLTGQLPYTGSAQSVLQQKRQRAASPRAWFPDVDRDLSALCEALLSPDPGARPTGQDTMEWLGSLGGQARSLSRAQASMDPTLVGRRRQQGVLRDALTRVTSGASELITVRGEAGVGKSALCRSLVDHAAGQAQVLSARCHAQESVPYKAVDGLVDQVTTQLLALSPQQAGALVPPETAALSRLFPVLRQIPCFPVDSTVPRSAVDARHGGFSAFHALIQQLAQNQPLVVWLDDLQWSDQDSLELLAHVLARRTARTLWLITLRDDGVPDSEALRNALGAWRGPRMDLVLQALEQHDAVELATRLLEHRADPLVLQQLAAESMGNPLVLQQLAHDVREHHGDAPVGVSLESAVRRRLALLSPGARGLVELVAVAAQPLTEQTLAPVDVRAWQEALGSGLTRNHAWAHREETGIGVFHDRVRQVILGALQASQRMQCHLTLANALELSGEVSDEQLAFHLEGACEFERAVPPIRKAAAAAVATLAFDCAARLLERSLAWPMRNPQTRRALLTEYAQVLALQGRGAQSATQYLAAASGADADEQQVLQQCAAEQWLRAGHMAEGAALLKQVLVTHSITMKRSRAALGLARLRVRLQEVFPSLSARTGPSVLRARRADACWSAVVGWGLSDPLGVAGCHAHHYVAAMQSADPRRMALALAFEALHTSTISPQSVLRGQQLLARAQSLVSKTDVYANWIVMTARAIFDTMRGERESAYQQCVAAEQFHDVNVPGAAWELATLRHFHFWNTFHLGKVQDLRNRIPALLADARARGDIYSALDLQTQYCNLAWLAADQVAEARSQAEDAAAHLDTRECYAQHYYVLMALAHIDLYSGNPARALQRLNHSWQPMALSLLPFIRGMRVDAWFLRGRVLLANQAPHPQVMECVRRLQRESARWAQGYALMLRAGLAQQRHQAQETASLLTQAAGTFTTASLPLHAAIARRRLRELTRAPEQADCEIRAAGVVNVDRFCNVFAPVTDGL